MILDVDNTWECYNYLERHVRQNERYHFVYYWQVNDGKSQIGSGHIVTIDRDEGGRLRYYDPQANYLYINEQIVNKLRRHVVYDKQCKKPQILRVDDKKFNPYFIDDVVRQSRF